MIATHPRPSHEREQVFNPSPPHSSCVPSEDPVTPLGHTFPMCKMGIDVICPVFAPRGHRDDHVAKWVVFQPSLVA